MNLFFNHLMNRDLILQDFFWIGLYVTPIGVFVAWWIFFYNNVTPNGVLEA